MSSFQYPTKHHNFAYKTKEIFHELVFIGEDGVLYPIKNSNLLDFPANN